MKNKIGTRFLSLILSFLMLFSCFGMNTVAAVVNVLPADSENNTIDEINL